MVLDVNETTITASKKEINRLDDQFHARDSF